MQKVVEQVVLVQILVHIFQAHLIAVFTLEVVEVVLVDQELQQDLQVQVVALLEQRVVQTEIMLQQIQVVELVVVHRIG